MPVEVVRIVGGEELDLFAVDELRPVRAQRAAVQGVDPHPGGESMRVGVSALAADVPVQDRNRVALRNRDIPWPVLPPLDPKSLAGIAEDALYVA